MSTLALTCAALLWAADPSPEPRRFHDIDRDLTAALRKEATAKDLATRGAAVRELAALFTELDRDPRLLTSPGLQEHRARARGRLVTVQKQLIRDLVRADKDAKEQSRRAALLSASVDADQRELARDLAVEASLASYSLGGPAAVMQAAGARGGGAQADYGQELVDLITTTIFPDKWAVNGGGGECTIVYYRPLMCLVVTATGDAHRGVDGLLDGLRRP
jgi:hypothetical protein